MLPTFLLNTIIKIDKSKFKSLLINPEGYNPVNNFFTNLKSAIEWSILHKEDIIYCICDKEGLKELDLNVLDCLLQDIVPQGIYAFYVHATYGESVNINKHCKAIYDIQNVSSFILTRPIYQLVLLFSEIRNEFPEMDRINFMQKITPHFFCFNSQNNNIARLKETKFHIVSPYRNVMPYIQECIDSVKAQSYERYHIYFVDDASTDNGASIIPDEHNISVKINKSRKYALPNILNVLLDNPIAEDDIVCLLDADDKLAHKYVLTILDGLYKNPSLLVTFGSMKYLNCLGNYGSKYSPEEFNNIRHSPWRAVPLRTFRYKVFKEYIRQDPELNLLRNSDGQIIKMPYDRALFYPLLELAGYENTKFIPSVMYEYRLHENNDQYLNRNEQSISNKEIRMKTGLKKFF
ncbi:glycosyltransferase family A protein [Parapedobacter indicus]|uniref:Glycosyl transferase family 2 n=1 Tax=Parapedobacter indicus TaxID=1477437 RepID=A0A1I3HSL0_9SPHI|nr:glycosyltransferase family A protein [Parapedobacter indicus]PPL03153.1 glycosyl transferase family 2 [Parapedobacter indicus]SFI38748.1 Glycosyl transferase family 2 [Parapedobacter indicus]